MTIGMPKTVGDFQRTQLSYETPEGELTHNIDVKLKDGEERPSYRRQMNALNRGIDRFHREIRRAHGHDAKDPIRTVR